MKYIYDPPRIPFKKGDFEDSPLFQGGGGGGSKTLPYRLENCYRINYNLSDT